MATVTDITSRSGPLLTAEQVAAALRVAPTTVRRWGRQGKIPAIRTCDSCGVIKYRETDMLALFTDWDPS